MQKTRIPNGRQANKYCSLSSLRNESDVEQFLLLSLLKDLGYDSEYLETKATIKQETVGKGKRRRGYVPDYLGYTSRSKTKPVLIVDAKHPDESAESGVEDAQLYASVIRRRMTEPKPIQYCVGCNGHRLIVKHYDTDQVLYNLTFADIANDSPLFKKFVEDLSRDRLSTKFLTKESAPNFEFKTVSPIELPALFEACHRIIWKAEKRSPASAFYEFAKLMFVKIDEDRRLHAELSARYPQQLKAGLIPANTVRFSVHWIEELEQTTDNPINTILFAQLGKQLEEQIATKQKKRIFEQGEGINLAPSTIKDAGGFPYWSGTLTSE